MSRPLAFVIRLVVLLAAGTACGDHEVPRSVSEGMHEAQAAPVAEPAGAVARRVLAADRFSDHGYPGADGREIATIEWSSGDLALRDLATGALRTLGVKRDDWTSPTYIDFTRLSPDGRRIAYTWYDSAGRYSVRVVDREGKGMRVVYADTSYFYMELNGFAPDNRHVVVELDRRGRGFDYGWLDLDTGAMRLLFVDVPWVMGDVFFSPDGRFLVHNGGSRHPTQPARDPMIVEIATSRTWRLVQWPSDDSPVGITPDGRGVVLASDRGGSPAFWLQPIRDGRADGEPRLLHSEAWNVTGLGVTQDGRLHYAVRTGAVHPYQVTLDTVTGTVATEPVRLDERPARYISVLGVSTNGEWVAYAIPQRTPLAGPPTITLRSTTTGETRELRVNLGFVNRLALWSPDDSRILVWGTDPGQRPGLFVVDVSSGRVTTVQLTPLPLPTTESPMQLGWTRDGRGVLLVLEQPDSSQRIVARDLATGVERDVARRPKALRLSPNPQISPDGRRVIRRVPGGVPGEETLRVESLDGTEGRDLVHVRPPGHYTTIRWSRDGRWLFAVRVDVGDGRVHVERVSVADGTTQDLGTTLRGNHAMLAPHPDGRRLFLTAGDNASELWVLERFLPSP